MVRQALRALAYPLVVGGSAVGVWAGLGAGLDASAVMTAQLVAAALAVIALERVLPFRPRWGRSHRDLGVDATHALIGAGANEAGRLLGLGLARALPGLRVWPSLPLAAGVALALVVAELPIYALHRWQHGGGLLWRVHAVHHSVPRMYWLNVARNHPLDSLATALLTVAACALLGASELEVTLMIAVAGAHGFLQHSNVDARLGPLNRLLSMAEVHRWHHSRRLDEANANYGQTLLVWDHVFGSYRRPHGEPPVDVGLADMPDFPQSYLGQLAAPFRASLFRRGG